MRSGLCAVLVLVPCIGWVAPAEMNYRFVDSHSVGLLTLRPVANGRFDFLLSVEQRTESPEHAARHGEVRGTIAFVQNRAHYSSDDSSCVLDFTRTHESITVSQTSDCNADLGAMLSFAHRYVRP